MKRIIAGLLAALLAGFGTASAVSANAVQTHWEGIDATGVLVKDEDCPLVVDDEHLLFEIGAFPEPNGDPNANTSLPAKVTATYTFRNPADYTVEATLLFPFGHRPVYARGEVDESGASSPSSDTDAYTLSVDGVPIERHIRHTLFYPFDHFETDAELARLSDDLVEDPFYGPDLPVTRYRYRVSGIDEEQYPAATAATDIGADTTGIKVLFLEQNGMQVETNGDIRINGFTENGETLTLYLFGEPPDQIPAWQFYEDGGVKDKARIDGEATLLPDETVTMTFRDFALTDYDPSSDIDERDWYNARVAQLRRHDVEDRTLDGIDFAFDLSGRLMRWYEYTLSVTPGARITHTVEAPLYPAIDAGTTPPSFTYRYLLSPAKGWAAFGPIEVEVRTPFHLLDTEPEGFEATDGGYALHLDGLPDSELTFSLSESEHPERAGGYFDDDMKEALIIGGLLGLLVVVGVAVILRRMKRRRHEAD